MMGTGEATGDDRALLAAQNAIANPLLDETSLKGAKAVLVNITGGLDMTLLEVDEAANAISAEVDGDANIIFGAAFDPALDGKIRVSVVATGMDEVGASKIEPPATGGFDARRPNAPVQQTYASRLEPIRESGRETGREPVREPLRSETYRAPEPAPVVPTFSAPPPAPAPQPEPVIHVAEERTLEPIIDPWVEEFESDRRPAAQVRSQGDLYLDRGQPAAEREAAPAYDDRDHRRSGWSLFGKKPRQPEYAPTPRQQAAPNPPMQAVDAEDDLEIPSFLRRLAN